MRIARKATQILPLVEKNVATTEHLYFNVWTELDKMNVSLPRTPYPKSSLSHHQLFTRAAVQQQTVEYGSTMMSWPEDRFRYSMKSSKQNRITERTQFDSWLNENKKSGPAQPEHTGNKIELAYIQTNENCENLPKSLASSF